LSAGSVGRRKTHVEQDLVFALAVPDLAAGVARLGEDSADGVLAPGDPAAVPVTARVIGGRARDAVRSEPLGDRVDPEPGQELREDPHDHLCHGLIDSEDVQRLPSAAFAGLGCGPASISMYKAADDGTEISVSAIARAAAVDRSFLYRHRDLLGKIHALEASPLGSRGSAGPSVTRASLQADLLAAHERAIRLTATIQQLEHRLSEALGEQAWHQSGLGMPTDIGALNQKIIHLEQQAIDLRLQLEERNHDLTAARSANRELMAQLNQAIQRR
jgi:hypothetical protein